MKFFVTGGAGFIGSAFVRMLLDSAGAAAQRASLLQAPTKQILDETQQRAQLELDRARLE